MSEQIAPYVTLDVFTSRRFKGNPVAIVNLNGLDLNSQEKQIIAKEFNFSETVFLKYGSRDQNPQVEIFTPVNEMEFAGHPIIGTGHFIFRQLLADTPDAPNDLDIITKAGAVHVSIDRASGVVSAEVPHNIHVHQREATLDRLLPVQSALRIAPNLEDVNHTSPVVSIVKGVTYVLTDLSKRSDIFANLQPGASPVLDLDEEWSPSFTGIMYYQLLSFSTEDDGLVNWNIKVRMIAINLEDPACGSGSSSLAAYLATTNGQKGRQHRFLISQGYEMGRDSDIIMDVLLNEERTHCSTIKLAGQAAFVCEGKISVN